MNSGEGETLTRIVGIVLVRNEDRFVRRVVENISGFCDRMILADNASTDGTAQILQKLAASDPARWEYHRLESPAKSHDLLAGLAGTDTWVFAADGDEIYDPVGLAAFRNRVLAGEFAASWMVVGNVLNCSRLDEGAGKAVGYLSPPSRSITKLYNFAAIDSWDGPTPERLHGGRICFRPGYSGDQKRLLHKETSWEASPLRCLHVCFLPRSHSEFGSETERENIMEMQPKCLLTRARQWIARCLGQEGQTSWKRDRYCRGPLTTVETAVFFKDRTSKIE